MSKLRQIVLEGDPILREKAQQVLRFNSVLHELLDDMQLTLRDAKGVGLAAPQVGVSKRAAIVEIEENLYELINPVIIKAKGQKNESEGCLSIPGIRGMVPRALKLEIKAQDRFGQTFRLKAEDFLARAIQHEIDHLEGQLFIDIMVEEVEE